MKQDSFKLAVVSDVHGDVHALADALAAAERIRCDEVVCLGDLVDHGLFPDEVIAVLASRRIVTVLGNHDRWALERSESRGGGWPLDPASRRWLRGLPPAVVLDRAGVRVALHHGSPAGDLVGIDPDALDEARVVSLLAAARADALLVGHTHRPFSVRRSGGLVANPGALLRDPGPGADGPDAPGLFGVLGLPSLTFESYRATGERVALLAGAREAPEEDEQ